MKAEPIVVVGILGLAALGIYLATRPKALPGGTYTPGNAMPVWNNAVSNNASVGWSLHLQGPNGEPVTASFSSNPAILAPAAGTTDGYIALSKGTATLTGTYMPANTLLPATTLVSVTVA